MFVLIPFKKEHKRARATRTALSECITKFPGGTRTEYSDNSPHALHAMGDIIVNTHTHAGGGWPRARARVIFISSMVFEHTDRT